VALDAGRDDVNVEIVEDPAAGEGADQTYTVRVSAGAEKEEFPGLSLKKGRNNLATKVNAQSKLIKIEETGASLPEAQRVPAAGSYKLSAPSIDPSKVKPTHFEGDVARRKGMGGLAAVDEITMVVMPDIMTLASDNGDDVQIRDLQGKMIAHCENAGDRMAILDCPPDMLPQEILEWRMNTAGYDSKFAALYYPWIEVQNPLTNQPMMIPPSGHVAGLWCRTDGQRGVHKAPANEVVMGANGLGFQVTHAEQGGLNKVGINCIRSFPGRGIRVWGARTLSSDPEWRYINVRRLFNFVSESIMEGTQWSVFEPNDEKLWIQLRIAAANFLTRVWSDGALFGSTPAEAFYVKCDSETNPPEVIEAGQVICEIGIAPVKPAEFVVFRLSQFSGGEGSAVSE
jgi:phage tail sheath protein FI